ncbi:class I SAM-dependent methyltransferase [Granulicella cerasi]|uniref:S-adenosyl-L-methionine-dependent methyltransferase n=1 Tax=Granulicella cerasi TaxID=741063 RepID=A0ABW1ZC49_9BACT|nr:class I SAM-dependent methyltransferase [Granulicella cerasi]
MIHAQPSKTALRVALRRAAHQLHDDKPLVFEDPLAVCILPPAQRQELTKIPDKSRKPHSGGLRAWMVARSKLSEDLLAASVAKGVAQQYLVLGAGLDTFAYRNPHESVQVFEVDHPATQLWKFECLANAHIQTPANAHHVAVDFEHDSLEERLRASGFRFDQPTVIAWLGVVPYLTDAGFRATINTLGKLPAGSQLVFDYALHRELLSPEEQLQRDSMSARVAQVGEPFRLSFSQDELAAELKRAGWILRGSLSSDGLNLRYFDGRGDGLRLLGSSGQLAVAEHAQTEL